MSRKTLKERLVSVTETMVKKYYFRFSEYGWATIVVDDAHGDLLINSDWGKWCHTWGGGPRSWGYPTFTEFLVSASPDYLANKLGYETETRERDVEATRKRLKDQSFELMNHQKIDKVLYDELNSDIDEFCEAYEEDESFAVYNKTTELMNEWFDCIHEWFEYRTTYRHAFLIEELLPVFLAYLKGELSNERERLPETL